MPKRKKSDPFYTLKKHCTVYAFLSDSSCKCIVWYTNNQNLTAIYNKNYYCYLAYSKAFFEAEKKENVKPGMYKLYSGEITQAEAFRYCIVWAAIFKEEGFENVNSRIIEQYIVNLNDENRALFDVERPQNLKNFLKTNCIFEQKSILKCAKLKLKESEKIARVQLRIPKEMYYQLFTSAEKAHMTVTKYLTEIAENGEINQLDMSGFYQYTDKLEDCRTLIKGMIAFWLETGECFDEDLKILQGEVLKIEKITHDLTRELNKKFRSMERRIARIKNNL